MMQQLPSPRTLQAAVQEVIRQNQGVGYNPTWFISTVEGGYAPDLVGACNRLIFSPEAVAYLERGVSSHPSLLTLEDLIVKSEYGGEWGFSLDAIEQAAATVEWLDLQVGRQRWQWLAT